MSAAEEPAKVHPKPNGYTDGAKTGCPGVWLNSKSRFGMRYKCKACGKTGSGYGGEERSHYSDCPETKHFRDARAERDAKRAADATGARRILSAQTWGTVDDDLVIHLAGLLPKVPT